MADVESNEKIDWRRVFRPAAVLIVLLGALIGIVYLFVKIEWFTFESLKTKEFVSQNLLYLLLTALFGAAVGAAEIISRYRDEPFIAVFSPPGLSYLLLNAVISAIAFFLVIHYQGTMFPNITDRLLASILAGFGSMVVMRSKLFSFKTEAGELYAVGPEAVLAIFLSSVDRQIDRYRASRRQELVYDQTCDIADAINAPSFLRAFLVSYQNLSGEEKQKINADIKDTYANQELATPLLKFMAVAFGFLNIMGEKNFKALILQLKRYQKLSGAKVPPTPTAQHSPASVPGSTKAPSGSNLGSAASIAAAMQPSPTSSASRGGAPPATPVTPGASRRQTEPGTGIPPRQPQSPAASTPPTNPSVPAVPNPSAVPDKHTPGNEKEN